MVGCDEVFHFRCVVTLERRGIEARDRPYRRLLTTEPIPKAFYRRSNRRYSANSCNDYSPLRHLLRSPDYAAEPALPRLPASRSATAARPASVRDAIP